jgi:hypothetical protein
MCQPKSLEQKESRDTYKQVATVLLVANSAVGAAELVLLIVAAKVGEVARAPMERNGGALAAFLSLVATGACVGRLIGC